MEKRYLRLLSREYPTEAAAAGEIVNLSAMRSLPKGTEYFFSDIHGEYEAFLHMLKSASGMIREKIDAVFGKSVSVRDRDELASLIYRPETYLKAHSGTLTDEWRRLVLYRLILVSQRVGAKYTRGAVREKMPKGYAYILDELLNVTDDINRDFYYDEIIASILDTGVADSFITAMCTLIRRLTVDQLHIIGDIFDRGPRADRIMDELMAHAHVDIQWGNHDVSWMGAAAGCPALIANVIRIALSYNSYDVLEDGYGLNLRPLSVFATEVYGDDPCRRFLPHTLDDVVFDHVDALLTARMHKAVAVIQCKLEGQLLRAHPEYRVYVAAQGDTLAAAMFVYVIPKVPKPGGHAQSIAYLTNVYTLPEWRNQGVGTRLLQAIEQALAAQRCELLFAWPSERSVPWYARNGFRAENEIMECPLSPE